MFLLPLGKENVCEDFGNGLLSKPDEVDQPWKATFWVPLLRITAPCMGALLKLGVEKLGSLRVVWQPEVLLCDVGAPVDNAFF